MKLFYMHPISPYLPSFMHFIFLFIGKVEISPAQVLQQNSAQICNDSEFPFLYKILQGCRAAYQFTNSL